MTVVKESMAAVLPNWGGGGATHRFSGVWGHVKNTGSPQLPAETEGGLCPGGWPRMGLWRSRLCHAGRVPCSSWAGTGKHFVPCSLPGEFPPRSRGSLSPLRREWNQEEWVKVVPSRAWCLARRGNNRLMLLHVAAVVLGDFSPCCSLTVPAGILD